MKFQRFTSSGYKDIGIRKFELVAKLNSFEEFKTFLATTFNQFKPSVIALQTIWNKPQNLEFILENYHPLHFRIRDKQGLNNNSGGGVGFWVENSFYFEPAECISIFIPRVFESQFIKIKTGKNKYILVGNIYRP